MATGRDNKTRSIITRKIKFRYYVKKGAELRINYNSCDEFHGFAQCVTFVENVSKQALFPDILK